MNSLQPSPKRTIVVAVSGGIAAYKAVQVVRTLVLSGHDVHVVATRSALRFVGDVTFAAISGNEVSHDIFENPHRVDHISLAKRADVIVVVPATANTIASLAHGFANDALGATILASTSPVIFAPAMHTEMWQNPATQANVSTLIERGWLCLWPTNGRLTGTDEGSGRMAEPHIVCEYVELILHKKLSAPSQIPPNTEEAHTPFPDNVREKDLTGLNFVVTAGGTREPLDPVRFLGNRSSGKQGIALAVCAQLRGAHVTLIAANVEQSLIPATLNTVSVSDTEGLRDEIFRLSSHTDVVIMAAAVADFQAQNVSEVKIKKTLESPVVTLTLVPNRDILSELCASKRPDQLVVGFAAETEKDDTKLVEIAREKQRRKGADLLVANRVGWNEGLHTENNSVIILGENGIVLDRSSGSKTTVASAIIDQIVAVNETHSKG